MDFLDKLRHGILSSHPDTTEETGFQFAAHLPENCAVALSGDLGTGKTTFTRGIARGFGISSAVTSPTYNIYSVYNGNRQLLHMDAYRLHNARELESLAIEDILRPPYLIAVEWPDNIRGFFEDYTSFWLTFEITKDHRHNIILK